MLSCRAPATQNSTGQAPPTNRDIFVPANHQPAHLTLATRLIGLDKSKQSPATSVARTPRPRRPVANSVPSHYSQGARGKSAWCIGERIAQLSGLAPSSAQTHARDGRYLRLIRFTLNTASLACPSSSSLSLPLVAILSSTSLDIPPLALPSTSFPRQH